MVPLFCNKETLNTFLRGIFVVGEDEYSDPSTLGVILSRFKSCYREGSCTITTFSSVRKANDFGKIVGDLL